MASLCVGLLATLGSAAPGQIQGHPRLYFTSDELQKLRELRTKGVHARIYQNIIESAEWCLGREPRTEWIAPVTPDPIYLNLYDRFYAMMHDMAVMEPLAFAHAYSEDARYLEAGRDWTLACCRVWSHEAEGAPDASKAYAVMRLLKGVAVSYDLLYHGLAEAEREEIRATLANVGAKYYQWYLDNPGMAGASQDKHHGSVEASSFGVMALALLGEVDGASAWLELMVKKHREYLLPQALTPSGTQEQSSNFWASTMQYRLFFMDALRRVTGEDLFPEFGEQMDGRIALAAVVGSKQPGWNQNDHSIMFGPSYGQLDYWSPVLLYLAREYRRPTYQLLALRDHSMGALQQTRYITTNGEHLLFELGGYTYAWYDPSVSAGVEEDLPLSYQFADVGEAYARASFEEGALAVGTRNTMAVLHAGGEAIVDVLTGGLGDALALTDDGETATLSAGTETGPGLFIELQRPGVLKLKRIGAGEMRWWCHRMPERDGNMLTWDTGVRLRVVRGSIESIE
ncbi:MAG TPA: DUF4962 domain-containing protein, partial [Armatimonadota bacterium]|nr:DUF4962 domain-containing protein [Armatimonadota bacterium]